jgi:Putative zinc-finger
MSCEKWRTQIALYVEGDVSPRKNSQVEKHLGTCPSCRRFAGELSQSQAVLKSLGYEAIDDRVFKAVQDRVMDQLASGRIQAPSTVAPSLRRNWRWVGAMTMGLLLLLGGLAFWKSSRETRPVSNGRLAGPAVHLEKNSYGHAATQVGNRTTVNTQEFARVQTVTEKAGAVQKYRPGKMLRKPPDRSRESTVCMAEKLSSEDERLVGFQPEEGKASLEVAQAESQEVKIGIDPEVTVPEPLVIKLVTDDPEIVIVWLADQNGGLTK